MNDLEETRSKLDTIDATLKENKDVSKEMVRSINIFLQPKIGRNKMQSREATNSIITACQYSIVDTMKEKVRNAIGVSKFTFYTNTSVITPAFFYCC